MFQSSEFWQGSALLPVLAIAALAALGCWLGAAGYLMRNVALLLAAGIGAGVAIYLVNGLVVLGALRDDPVGGAVWFGWVGLQLSALGIVIAGFRALRSAPLAR